MKKRVLAATSYFSLLRRGSGLVESMQPTTTCSIPGRKVYWEGPLFGRLLKSGKRYLEHRWGFQRVQPPPVDDDASRERLAFVWPNKSGPQFSVDDATAAHVRPYPKEATDFLDDKILLSQTLKDTGLMPPHLSSPSEAKPDRLYFVKHRRGAQGRSVYVYNQQELCEWWNSCHNPQDFLIQEEIVPSLFMGCKFVLRAHILLVQRSFVKDEGSLKAYLHDHVICQDHATAYHPTGDSKAAAHISQAGKKNLPTPRLLLPELVDPFLHPAATALPKIRNLSRRFVHTIIAPTFEQYQDQISQETTCFALLGLDILIDKSGTAKLCEINTHPALGWGTMSNVPPQVFDSLIEESLSLVLDRNASIEGTRFERLL